MEKKNLHALRLCHLNSCTSVKADGRALPSQASNRSFEMSNEVKRLQTFAKFPHKDIILKLQESGYFYSGNDDTTICHKCHAIVNGWKPDDDPRLFHEINCSYRNSGNQDKSSDFQSFESTTGSLLDEPVQDTTGKVPLSPIVLPSGQSTGTEGVPLCSLQNIHSGASQSRIGDNWSLQISSEPRNSVQSMDLSPSAVEVSVESNSSDRGPAFPQDTRLVHMQAINSVAHQEQPLNPSGNLPADVYNFPTQVSDADVEITSPEEAPPPSISRHLSNRGQIRPHSAQSEGRNPVDPTDISQNSEEQTNAMQLDNEWASVFPCQEPNHPNMRNLRDRLETFSAFWTDGLVGNISVIAQAGFYCYDFNMTRCWYCCYGDHEWMPNEDPWEVHAALYPNCEFLLQQKGPGYISDVSSRRPRRPTTPAMPISPESPATPQSPSSPESPHIHRISISSNSSDDSPFSSIGSFDPHPGNITIIRGNQILQWGRYGRESQTQPPRVVDPREEESKRRKLLETSMNSEKALAAMEMGFELPMIKRVIKRKIWRTDETYASLAALLDDLLHPPADLDSDSEEDEDEDQEATGNATGGANETPEQGIRGAEQARPTDAAIQRMNDKELDEKLREFEHEKRCKVCLDHDANVVFTPCGHLCTCVECAEALRTCPLCRKRIQKSIKTYTS